MFSRNRQRLSQNCNPHRRAPSDALSGLGVLAVIGLGLVGVPSEARGTCNMIRQSGLYMQDFGIGFVTAGAAMSGDRLYLQTVDFDPDDWSSSYILATLDITNRANPILLGQSAPSDTPYLQDDNLGNSYDAIALGSIFAGISGGDLKL